MYDVKSFTWYKVSHVELVISVFVLVYTVTVCLFVIYCSVVFLNFIFHCVLNPTSEVLIVYCKKKALRSPLSDDAKLRIK